MVGSVVVRTGLAAEILTKFRTAVSDRMTEIGLSQEDVARALAAGGCKVHNSAISKVISGHREVRFEEAVLLASLLGLDLRAFAVEPTVCTTCFGAPPAGFTCNACGTGGAL